MNKIAEMQDYRKTPAMVTGAYGWLGNLSNIIESRYHDEDTIQQVLSLVAEQTGLSNISVALPDAPSRFKAQYSSAGIRNGIYSFAVQHALCRQFESGEWLVIKDGSERSETFNPRLDRLTRQDRCLLVPLTLRQSVLAVLVLDLRNRENENLDLGLVNFFGAQIAHLLATQVVPNFKTLYARPYQRVQADELDEIHAAIRKCSGNKTMAARVLGLTPRQLRYRLAKLGETEAEAS